MKTKKKYLYNNKKFYKIVSKLSNKYKYLLSKKKILSYLYITKNHPVDKFNHISITNNKYFINKYKKYIKKYPIKCEFKIKEFILYKTKTKVPHKPVWFRKNSDYPLVWFTAIINIINIENINKKSLFNINIFKNIKYKNLPHITLSILSFKNDKNNNYKFSCINNICYEKKEDSIRLKLSKNNTPKLNKLIKQMNKYKTYTFSAITNITEDNFLTYKVNINNEFKTLINYSIKIMNNLFSNLLNLK
jgi:hypothetical protein